MLLQTRSRGYCQRWSASSPIRGRRRMLRDGETTMKLRFAVWSGVGDGGEGKIVQKRWFWEVSWQEKLVNLRDLTIKDFAVISQTPTYIRSCEHPSCCASRRKNKSVLQPGVAIASEASSSSMNALTGKNIPLPQIPPFAISNVVTLQPFCKNAQSVSFWKGVHRKWFTTRECPEVAHHKRSDSSSLQIQLKNRPLS